MPREDIRKWSEKRLIIGLFLVFIVPFIFLELLSFILQQPIYLLSSIYGMIDTDTGRFFSEDLTTSYFSNGAATMTSLYFVQCTLLLIAIERQWSIEPMYSIFRELIAITLCWLFCT